MLTLLPCWVSASAPAHSTGPQRSHRTGYYQLCGLSLQQHKRMIQHFFYHCVCTTPWRGMGDNCRNSQRNHWKAKPVSLLKSLPLARGPKPARWTGSGGRGGTGCHRQGVAVACIAPVWCQAWVLWLLQALLQCCWCYWSSCLPAAPWLCCSLNPSGRLQAR